MNVPLFLIPIFVGLIAQSVKPLFNKEWFAQLSFHGRKIPRYGGMPSAHTAFATSLATVVYMADGVSSASFAIACAGLILILDDALRMRIFLSRHGEALARLVKKLPENEQKDFPYLETRLGHKALEVAVGACLGVVLSIIVMNLVQ